MAFWLRWQTDKASLRRSQISQSWAATTIQLYWTPGLSTLCHVKTNRNDRTEQKSNYGIIVDLFQPVCDLGVENKEWMWWKMTDHL